MREALPKFGLWLAAALAVGTHVAYDTGGLTSEFIQTWLVVLVVGANVFYFMQRAPRLGRALAGALTLGAVLAIFFTRFRPAGDVGDVRNGFLLVAFGILVVDAVYVLAARRTANRH